MARAQEDKVRLPLTAARNNALKLDWSGAYVRRRPTFLGTKVFDDYPMPNWSITSTGRRSLRPGKLAFRIPRHPDDAKYGEAARPAFMTTPAPCWTRS